MSVWFDAAAERFVERAYIARGDWAGVYLAPPTIEQRRHLAALEIDPMEKDRWGEVRWVRAFKRSCFHLVNHYGGVDGLHPLPNIGAGTRGWHAPVRPEWDTGARVLKPGWPARRWAIRLAIHAGGPPATRAAQEDDIPMRRRWVDDDGHPTSRQSTSEDHTWEQ